jgi:hypothetical protein
MTTTLRYEKVYTYQNQPCDNVDAWRLGEACRKAADDTKCGDYIDRGLILLRELQSKGYGVVKLESPAQETSAALPCVRREGCKNRARCAAEEHCTGMETPVECGCDAPYREGYECMNAFNRPGVKCRRLNREVNDER